MGSKTCGKGHQKGVTGDHAVLFLAVFAAASWIFAANVRRQHEAPHGFHPTVSLIMARKCAITGKGPRSGNNVSHANNRTKRWFHPNLVSKRIWVDELGRHVRLKVSTKTLKAIDRDGLLRTLKKNGLQLKDVV